MSLFYDTDMVSVTIASGTALSPVVKLGPKSLVAIQMPAVWTAANITLQASVDGGVTFNPVYTGATPAVFTITTPAAATFIALDPTLLRGVNVLKVACSVNQAQNSMLVLVIRGV